MPLQSPELSWALRLSPNLQRPETVASSTNDHSSGRDVLHCRLCVRFTPVEYVVNASIEELKKLSARIIPEAFPPLPEATEPVPVRTLPSPTFTWSVISVSRIQGLPLQHYCFT